VRRLFDIARNVLGFARFVLRRWTEDRCPQIAGSLTYATLLELVPIFAVAVALLSSAPFFDEWMHQLRVFLKLNLAPAIAGHIVNDYLDNFAHNARRLTFPAVAFMLVFSVWLMLIIDQSLNLIWRVQRRRSYWLMIPVYLTALVLGPLLLAVSTAGTTYVVSLSMGLAPKLFGRVELFRMLSLLLSTLAFFIIYKTVPHRHVPWRHAVVGSAVAALLFESAKELFGVYVRHATTYSAVYGAFAALPLFLVWIHLSWMVLLLGAELTAALSYWHAHLWQRADRPGARFNEAVQVARLLVDAGAKGVDFESLRTRGVVPAHELDDLLRRLCDAGIVKRSVAGTFALTRDPTATTLAQLYEAAVAPLGGMRPEEWAEVSADFERAAREMRAGLDRPLAALSSTLPARPTQETSP
jgi:membrane protein